MHVATAQADAQIMWALLLQSNLFAYEVSGCIGTGPHHRCTALLVCRSATSAHTALALVRMMRHADPHAACKKHSETTTTTSGERRRSCYGMSAVHLGTPRFSCRHSRILCSMAAVPEWILAYSGSATLAERTHERAQK